ncbi:Microtubule-nucleating Tub4p (gamma-tubulin) complex component [Tulasnella sp. 418]|nr:Microtubule-nucleating Tub4p (gamma-tubulin) complex component [Tulasnella sp. 418]
MPPATPLLSLVQLLVPQTRSNPKLRNDLVEKAQAILDEHPAPSVETDVSHLGGLMKRQLQQGSSATAAMNAQRFTNLLSRFLDQDVVTQKHATLLFLQSLASVSPPEPAPRKYLPSLGAPPPQSRERASSLRQTSGPRTNGDVPSPAQPRTKAELLKEHRLNQGRQNLPEHLLLRDVLYLLQGISGKYVHFSDAQTPGDERSLVFIDPSRYVIPAPTRELIHRLSELGHLYSRVSSFIQASEGNVSAGLIKQSLCHHLQSQLSEYFRLVAVLESQMAQTAGDETDSTSLPRQDSGLTLRRLEVWVEEWRLRMRMMSVCVEGCKETSGGALVSLIHTYTDNGDPFVRQFTDALLEEVSKPFFSTLHRWIYFGELHDPFLEFFVAVDPNLADQQYVQSSNALDFTSERSKGKADSGLRLWKGKYKFRLEMLPRFLGEEFGRKIFSTGKSLNFIRYSCHDSDWVTTRNKLSNSGKVLRYSDISGLERSIDAAYRIASQRLFDVFFEKFKLRTHLLACKNYLLLSNGDFADHLMDNLTSNLSRPANHLSRHHLTGALETSISATNSRFDPPDVLRRLDARMLAYNHGEIGWDVFLLEYKVDAPIDTVLDPASMEKYSILFKYLWRMKRLETVLRESWMKLACGSKVIFRIPAFEAMLQFKEATDDLYKYSLGEAARLDSEKDAERGVYTAPATRSLGKEHLSRTLRLVEQFSVGFSKAAMSVYSDVNALEDQECKTLSVQLGFSDYYTSKRQIWKQQQQSQDSRAS